MKLDFIPIKTRIFQPPKDELWDILDALETVDGDIIFITSKIMAIHQGRCIKKDKNNPTQKIDLIKQEATHYLAYQNRGGFNVNITITDNVLMLAAGIDESNANDHYILWPKEIDKLCREIRGRLVKKHGIKNLGVIATDSHTTPLRWGVTGITLGLSGVNPLEDVRGETDIFGRKMNLTQVNVIDPLTSIAVLLMGEVAEQTPIVILRGYNGIQFDAMADMSSFKIPPEQDLYKPLLDVLPPLV
jgi:F420-0:gamma-glutamyl ligase